MAEYFEWIIITMRWFIDHLIFNNKRFFYYYYYFQTGVFITSSLCGLAVCVCCIFLLLILSFCANDDYYCGPQRVVAATVFVLSIVQCITGLSGCCCVVSSSSQVITNIKTSVCNFISRDFLHLFLQLG